MIKKIRLVDYGQDYLQFNVDVNGVVCEVHPFHDSFWRGGRVANHDQLEAGDFMQVEVSVPGKGLVTKHIMYPVESITTDVREEQACGSI